VCGEELQLDGRQVDAKKSTKNLSQKETLARPIRPRPFGREMSLRRFARGGLPVPVTTEFVISALTIIVPGCLTVCPSRTVRLTYRGGDCTMLPGLGAPASPSCSENREPRHTVFEGRTVPSRSRFRYRPRVRAFRAPRRLRVPRASEKTRPSPPNATPRLGVATGDAIADAVRAKCEDCGERMGRKGGERTICSRQ
jgi:hypothetical protein